MPSAEPSAQPSGSSETGDATSLVTTERSCDDARLILCEDFEDTPPGSTPADWTAEGDVEVVSGGHWGSQSLRSNPQPSWVRRINRDASAIPSEHWGRIFFRVQLPVTSAFVHSTFVALKGNGPTVGSAEYRVVDTVKAETDAAGKHTHQFLWNVQPDNGSEFGLGSDYIFSFDGEWHCAEWFVSGATQAYRFYHDGENVAPLDFVNGAGNFGSGQTKSDIPTTWSSIWVGFTNYQTAEPGFTAWVDDLAIASERIGCE